MTYPKTHQGPGWLFSAGHKPDHLYVGTDLKSQDDGSWDGDLQAKESLEEWEGRYGVRLIIGAQGGSSEADFEAALTLMKDRDRERASQQMGESGPVRLTVDRDDPTRSKVEGDPPPPWADH